MKQYLINLTVLFSQAINVVLFAGHPDQTVSARAYQNQVMFGWGLLHDMINGVFFWQDNHCRTSFEEDLQRARALLNAEIL